MDSTEQLVRQALEQLALAAGAGRLQQLQILQVQSAKLCQCPLTQRA